MIKAVCIGKTKFKNVTKYKLRDEQGKIAEATSEQIKQAIKSSQISISNMKITSNNRLIITKETKPAYLNEGVLKKVNSEKALYFKSNINLNTIRLKAQAIGAKLNTLGDSIYSLETESSIGIISDRQLYLPENSTNLFMYTEFSSMDFRGIDTSHVKIMESMFCDCMAKKINLSNFNTSSVTNMNSMFYRCTLDELDLSSFNTRNVENMSHMFYRCNIRKLIGLNKFNTSKVKNMISMFHGSTIDNIDLSSFDTSKVTDMSDIFRVCTTHRLKLSNFDTSSVENMSYMFYNCKAQGEIDLRAFNTSRVTNMCSMFCGCRADKLDISSFDTSNVSDMSDMFNYAEINELIGIEKFDTRKVKNMYGMFYNCETNEINISSFSITKEQDTRQMFYGCKAKIIRK